MKHLQNKHPVTWTQFNKVYVAILIFLLLILLSVRLVYAQQPITEPAQMPLNAQGAVALPNIMLAFDNSGSMSQLSVPDDLEEQLCYIDDFGYSTGGTRTSAFHPDDDSAVSGNNNILQTIASKKDDLYSAVFRCSQVNTLYYNPALTYKPWAKADGSLMPAYPANSVPIYANATKFPTAKRIDLTQTLKNYEFKDKTSGGGPRNNNYYCFRDNNKFTCETDLVLDEFIPALYFTYHGPGQDSKGIVGWNFNNPDIMDINNYTAVAIGEIGTGGILQANTRTDCTTLSTAVSGKVLCTKDEEFQNFANWYVYYRGRLRAAMASVSHVFAADQGVKFRIGWADMSNKLNTIDGIANFSYVKAGVRTFNAPERQIFYDRLFNYEGERGTSTPTRRMLLDIHKYFASKDNRGPWGAKPGSNDTTAHLSCRRSFVILFTDGYWNGSISAQENKNYDNTNGDVMTDIYGNTYQYTPVPPHKDEVSGTLADIAMKLWREDLRPDLANDVPASTFNPMKPELDFAFWQHLQLHTVGFGLSGGAFQESDYPDLIAGNLQWPTDKKDYIEVDLWHAAINGHGTYTAADSPQTVIDSLGAILSSITKAQLPIGHKAMSGEFLEAGNKVYSAAYTTGSWVGELSQHQLANDGKLGAVDWVASEGVPEHTQRNIWIGSGQSSVTALNFKWSEVSQNAALKAFLHNAQDNPADKDSNAEKLLNYLRGDTTNSNNGMYRVRTGVLGDIVNSIPVYAQSGKNLRYTRLPDTTTNNHGGYKEYMQSLKDREGVVFIGANDGMLHAFGTQGSHAGKEIFAYIPFGVAHKLAILADHDYDKALHRYYVDGPLSLTDAYWENSDCNPQSDAKSCWHNVLLGSTGAGSKTVFALDITNPNNYINTSSASNIKKVALWELNPQSTGMEELGFVMQPIQAGYTKSGHWVGVFGNGPYSKTGKSVLYFVNLQTGALIHSISVGNSTKSGLMGVSLVRDNKQVITGAYAGDLQGNIWKFDLKNSSVNNWNAQLLFTTTGNRPVTHAPIFTSHPKGGKMILFGTGKFYDTEDITDLGQDALYGVWDKGVTVANNSTTMVTQTPVAVKDGSGKVLGYTVQAQAPNWDKHFGWSMPLTMSDAQRNLYAPRLLGSDIIFDTTITKVQSNARETCTVTGLPGIKVTLNLFSGGLPSVKWDTNGDGVIDAQDNNYIGYPVENEGSDNTLYYPDLGSNSDWGAGSCAEGEIYINDGGISGCASSKMVSSHLQVF